MGLDLSKTKDKIDTFGSECKGCQDGDLNYELVYSFLAKCEYSCIKKPILGKISTTPFEKRKNPTVVIYIKPWDDEVFACFLSMLKY
jgi:hypothetical protein